MGTADVAWNSLAGTVVAPLIPHQPRWHEKVGLEFLESRRVLSQHLVEIHDLLLAVLVGFGGALGHLGHFLKIGIALVIRPCFEPQRHLSAQESVFRQARLLGRGRLEEKPENVIGVLDLAESVHEIEPQAGPALPLDDLYFRARVVRKEQRRVATEVEPFVLVDQPERCPPSLPSETGQLLGILQMAPGEETGVFRLQRECNRKPAHAGRGNSAQTLLPTMAGFVHGFGTLAST